MMTVIQCHSGRGFDDVLHAFGFFISNIDITKL